MLLWVFPDLKNFQDLGTSPVNGWCCGEKPPALSHNETEIMRGCFILLLHICATYGSAIEREDQAVMGPACTPGLDSGCGPTWVSDGFNRTELSGITGIVDLSSPNSSQPSPCPTLLHCKRPSRKNRYKMVCCLLVKTGGRYKCPNSCD